MKRSLWMAAAALGAAIIGGCTGGSGSGETGTPSAVRETEEFKVALLTPGPVSDAGWSAMAYDGLKAIESELGATINNQEAKGTQIRDAMRSYARQGYRLVFGHGFEYNEPGVEVAASFPNTVFVSSSGARTAPNAGAFRFYLEQGFYLAGMTAALMSQSGVVAMIGGDDVPSIRSTFKAFRAGAEAARPGVRVIETFTGNGSDQAAAKRATLTAIDQGADFIIHQANEAAPGVFGAARDRGVHAFGANLDQNDHASGVVLASAVIVARPAFVDLARRVKEGTFKGEVVLMGMKEGAIEYRFNPALESKVPADVRARIDQAKQEILDGTLVVPKDEF